MKDTSNFVKSSNYSVAVHTVQDRKSVQWWTHFANLTHYISLWLELQTESSMYQNYARKRKNIVMREKHSLAVLPAPSISKKKGFMPFSNVERSSVSYWLSTSGKISSLFTLFYNYREFSRWAAVEWFLVSVAHERLAERPPL